ncbi:hypothetical protein KM043_007140 [Ampulex compressa]|nr:hypothetical protein KM043_007140 [Ampulex compressa]
MKRWSSDMDYGFVFNRVPMLLLGTWPLQRDNFFYKLRWAAITLIEFAIVIIFSLEVFLNCGDAQYMLESLLVITAAIHSTKNNIISRIYSTTLATHMNSAMDDWSFCKNNKKFYSIMKRYARMGRLISMSHLVIGYIGLCAYLGSVLITKSEEIFDPVVNMTFIRRKYILPATCLAGNASWEIYNVMMFAQIVETLLLVMAESSTDSFVLNITLHLCGQLEILRQKFVDFGERKCSDRERKRELKTLIRRHFTLIQLGENLEQSYNISVLMQLILAACLLAVTGVRIIVSIRHHDSIEIVKSIVIAQFLMLQFLLISCSGDLLLHHSELIFSAIYNTSWHEFKPNIVKDLVFMMMRAKVPLRITGGKFIYVSRRTMMDILKTTASFVSFLQLTITDVD